jgi:GGDEF domain-containing protein
VEVEIEEEVEPPSQPVAVAEFPAIPELRLPPGYHDRSVLTTYLQSTDVLSGVVVAIGINDYSHHREKMGPVPMQELMQAVETMVSGLLREGVDFGCRSAEDEFILVFPNETGAEAQRRLTAISERLWNFQLRSLSNFSVLFSWGAVEVRGESLADSAASASERMYQTKRNRKTISMDTQRRKLAVNL